MKLRIIGQLSLVSTSSKSLEKVVCIRFINSLEKHTMFIESNTVSVKVNPLVQQ
jgi:hypothetical protein